MYTNYEQIKKEFPHTKENPNKAYNVFTDYVMDVITLKQRRVFRNNWNALNKPISWQDYLLKEVNKLK